MLARLENAAAAARDSFAETDLTALLHVVKDRLAPRAEAAGVRLTVVAPDTLPAVCQSEFLEHALVNLIDNALRYSGTEEITLTAAATADHLLISVEDHGIGIPPEHHARIFERFYRVDASHQRASGGTGLGLAIVKHIARLHRGDVTLTVPDGGGSCFTLSLPRSPFSH
jgi:signal transduction histidine kinase